MRDVRIGELSSWGFVLVTPLLFGSSVWLYQKIPFGTTRTTDTAAAVVELSRRVGVLEQGSLTREEELALVQERLAALDQRLQALERQSPAQRRTSHRPR